MANTTNDPTTKSPPSSNENDDDEQQQSCTPDDLIELIRAIKFAHTDMSIRNVHTEISQTMAESDVSYAFLKDVKLNDVKKVWKKALKGGPSPSNATNPPPSQNSSDQEEAKHTKQTQSANPESPPPIIPTEGIIKFYTIGDGSVKTLVENCANHYAKAAIADSQPQTEKEVTEKDKHTHFFLDVPADLSGSRPHQALINYQENHTNKSGKQKGGGKKKGKKSTSSSNDNGDGREIFKIQVPQLPPGMEDELTVMLLYNQDRSAKTFIHPPADNELEDDGGYAKIRQMIIESGKMGALGATGGQKGYFYGFISNTKTGPNVVSIDLQSGLAPVQTW